MPALEWVLLCENHLVDNHQRDSLIVEFDAISGKTFPLMMSRFFVVSRWRVDVDESFVFRALLVNPGGNMLGDGKAVATRVHGLSPIGFTCTASICFNATQFNEPGTYRIEICANDVFAHTIFLPVILESKDNADS
jgi:hypothetical protein